MNEGSGDHEMDGRNKPGSYISPALSPWEFTFSVAQVRPHQHLLQQAVDDLCLVARHLGQVDEGSGDSELDGRRAGFERPDECWEHAGAAAKQALVLLRGACGP